MRKRRIAFLSASSPLWLRPKPHGVAFHLRDQLLVDVVVLIVRALLQFNAADLDLVNNPDLRAIASTTFMCSLTSFIGIVLLWSDTTPLRPEWLHRSAKQPLPKGK